MNVDTLTALVCLGLMGASLVPAVHAEPEEPIRLWKSSAPGERGDIPKERIEVGEKDGIERTRNVSVPTMQFFPPAGGNGNGAAVLVCPGGGYSILASEHEGSAVCKWLNTSGYAAILLKYRVPRRDLQAKHHAPLQDAQRAISMIRNRAAEWKIDPTRIGVLGFSAGGHLATMTLASPERTFPADPEIDEASCRPDFGILIYPAYLTDENDDEKITADLEIDKITQPVFIAVASNDKWAPSSVVLNKELSSRNVPVKLKTFPEGGHGFGLKKDLKPPVSEWPQLCASWLKSMNLDKAKGTAAAAAPAKAAGNTTGAVE